MLHCLEPVELMILQAAGQRELIAMYASALGEGAEERYAIFLASLELSADITERRLALMRARDQGLDMARIAVLAAEKTMDHALAVCASPSAGHDYILKSAVPRRSCHRLLDPCHRWGKSSHQ